VLATLISNASAATLSIFHTGVLTSASPAGGARSAVPRHLPDVRYFTKSPFHLELCAGKFGSYSGASQTWYAFTTFYDLRRMGSGAYFACTAPKTGGEGN
jgi:hypothetical protein